MEALKEHHIYSRSPLSTYHMENKLLIQFILYEMIRAFDKVTLIKNHLNHLKISENGRFSIQSHKNLDELVAIIKQLSGQTHQHHQVFTWNLTEGILAKLKHYCSFLASNLDTTEHQIANIKRNADRTWIHSIEMLDHLRMLRLLTIKQPSDISGLNELFTKMINRAERLSKVIANLLGYFRDEECVLLFLLRYQEKLDTIYGDDFVSSLCKRFYKGGINEVTTLVQQRYALRHFNEVLPKTCHKI